MSLIKRKYQIFTTLFLLSRNVNIFWSAIPEVFSPNNMNLSYSVPIECTHYKVDYPKTVPKAEISTITVFHKSNRKQLNYWCRSLAELINQTHHHYWCMLQKSENKILPQEFIIDLKSKIVIKSCLSNLLKTISSSSKIHLARSHSQEFSFQFLVKAITIRAQSFSQCWQSDITAIY